MEAVRRYVFPVVWMVILGLIAAALVKMAFFGDDASAQAGDEVTPTAQIDQYATVPVERGDIASALTLPSTVEADASTPMKAAYAGEVTVIYVANGDHVEQGDKIIEVRTPNESAAAADPAADGAAGGQAAATGATTYSYHQLRAGAAGTIGDIAPMKGQSVNIGDTVASISPGTYAITAKLTPEQQLQLLDQDIHATAAVPTTPDPVPCQAPRIVENDPAKATAQTPSSGDGMTEEGYVDGSTDGSGTSSGAAATLRCPVPAGTRIVPGLGVDVTVDLGTAQGVLTLPTTAVEGELNDGTVYVLDDASGEPVPLPVTLGKRGEGVVEITGGLEEGQEVLQFVPGVENEDAGDDGGTVSW